MRVISIRGGLGNQMFQYAFAYALQKEYPTEKVLLDTSWFKGQNFRSYELSKIFNISLIEAHLKDVLKVGYPQQDNKCGKILRFLLPQRRSIFKEPCLFNYCEDAIKIDSDIYYIGSWQNPKYFMKYRDDILNEFEFKIELTSANKDLLSNIISCDSVSVHVRRGDYLFYERYKNICEVDYYERAIDFILSAVNAPHFFIFSNDPEWCRTNLSHLFNRYTIVDWNTSDNSFYDMYLMSMCKHNIIAHSSFSWWSSWLNKNPCKIVCCPQKWINLEYKCETPQLSEWIKI